RRARPDLQVETDGIAIDEPAAEAARVSPGGMPVVLRSEEPQRAHREGGPDHGTGPDAFEIEPRRGPREDGPGGRALFDEARVPHGSGSYTARWRRISSGRRSATRPRPTTSPRSRMAYPSASERANSTYCSTSKMVMPRSLRSRSTRAMSATSDGWIPSVGSS